MYRDIRPQTFTYKGESITVEMPGWYGDNGEESLHSAEDMKISDEVLRILKERVQVES